MPWNVNLNKKRLYFSKVPGNGKYRLEHFIDVVTNDGEVYREPLPTDARAVRSMEFDEVVLLADHLPIKRDDSAGLGHLNNTNNKGYNYARS